MNNQSLGNYWPAPGRLTKNNKIGAGGAPYMDSVGNLCVRGAVTTDEGSIREDFQGTTIYSSIPATSISFTNGDKAVTAVGATFTSSIAYGDYIKLSTDTDANYAKVQSVINDNQLELVSAYAGSTGTGTGYKARFKPLIGTGGAISVANSVVTITSGTTIASRTEISREIDYGPLALRAHASLSQRVANQTAYIGFADDSVSPTRRAWFVLDGTDNTKFKTETASGASANDTETSSIMTLPNGLTTASNLRFRVVLNPESCAFYVNEFKVSEHFQHLPDQYTGMLALVGWVNGGSAPVTSNILCDLFYVSNFDQLNTSTVVEQSTYTNCSQTNNGGLNYKLISAATTNATTIKPIPGRIHSISLTNASGAIKYLKLYDKATAPTVGTDVPIMTIGVPAGQSYSPALSDVGIYFSNGISFATTGAITDADTTSLALSDMAINITYA